MLPIILNKVVACVSFFRPRARLDLSVILRLQEVKSIDNLRIVSLTSNVVVIPSFTIKVAAVAVLNNSTVQVN